MTQGTTIPLSVIGDVSVDGKVLIKSNWPASAVLSDVKSSGLFRGGRIRLELRSLVAVDGREVLVTGGLHERGDDNVGQTVILGLLFLPLWFFLEGDDVSIPFGTVVRGYVAQDYQIEAP
jgi:hypothetical protein